MKQEIKAIVFDIGGVMNIGDNDHKIHYPPICKLMKIDIDKFFKLYYKYIGKASRGVISGKQMIRFIARDLGVNKNQLLKNWIKYKKKAIRKNYELEKIIKKLKKNYKIGTLTGAIDLHYKLCKEKKIYDVFDFNICSFKVGYNKPDMEIYKLLLKKIKIPADEIVFIDDTKICLPPARKLGIKTILFKNNTQLVKILKNKE